MPNQINTTDLQTTNFSYAEKLLFRLKNHPIRLTIFTLLIIFSLPILFILIEGIFVLGYYPNFLPRFYASSIIPGSDLNFQIQKKYWNIFYALGINWGDGTKDNPYVYHSNLFPSLSPDKHLPAQVKLDLTKLTPLGIRRDFYLNFPSSNNPSDFLWYIVSEYEHTNPIFKYFQTDPDAVIDDILNINDSEIDIADQFDYQNLPQRYTKIEEFKQGEGTTPTSATLEIIPDQLPIKFNIYQEGQLMVDAMYYDSIVLRVTTEFQPINPDEPTQSDQTSAKYVYYLIELDYLANYLDINLLTK